MEEPPAPSKAPSPARAETLAFVTCLLAGTGAAYTVPSLARLCGGNVLPEAFPSIWPPGVDLRQMLTYTARLTAAAVAGTAIFRATPRLAVPALALVNVALFSFLCPSVFLDFLAGVREESLRPSTWPGNHSSRSFVLETASLSNFAALTQAALVLFLVAAVLSSAPSADSTNLLPPRLLLTLTLAALLLPAQSHDYKLVLLPGPLALFVGTFSPPGTSVLRFRRPVLAGAMGAAFATTLVPYGLKPAILGNNAPALRFLLAATTLSGARAFAGASSPPTRVAA